MIIAAVLAAGWLSFAPVLTPRQEVAVAAAGGKVYLIGGIGDAGVILDSVEVFDPVAGTWRFVASIPRPRHHAAAATVGDAIYVIGGYETLTFAPTTNVYRYDTLLDQWTEVAPLPSPRGALGAATIDGKIYAVGGVPGGRALLVYEPATNAWTALPPLPTARSGIAAAVLGGRMYVFGGEGNAASFTGIFPQTESFDFATSTWRSEPLMKTPRHGIGAATIGKLIFIPAGATVQGFGTSSAHDAFFTEAIRRRSVRH